MSAITTPDQCSPVPDYQAYAERVLSELGCPVFVCGKDSKVPATEHGFQDAKPDPEVLAAELQRVPGGNLAIPTGPVSGFDVLDVDHRADGSGWATWRLLQAEGYLPEPLAIVRTPSSGGHFYYAASGRNSGRLPKHWLDYKAAGGYVLVPPSVVGTAYEWVKPLVSTDGACLDWDAIVARLTPRRTRPANPIRPAEGNGVGHLVGWVAALPEGNRNSGLFWAACRAVDRGCHDELDRLADAAIKAGLDPREAERTIRSAERRGGAV